MTGRVKTRDYLGAIELRLAFKADSDHTAEEVLEEQLNEITGLVSDTLVFEAKCGDIWQSRNRRPERYTHLEMEAALCVWEWICEVTLENSKLENVIDEDWKDLRESVGSVELRHGSIALGKWCLKVHGICTQIDANIFDALSYDWEVIPAIMRHARDDDGPVYISEALPDPELVAPKVLADLGIHVPKKEIGYWKEVNDDDRGGLTFFQRAAVNEDFFPDFAAVTLEISAVDAARIIELSNIAQDAAKRTGERLVTFTISSGVSRCLSVFVDKPDAAFAFTTDYCDMVINVVSGDPRIFFQAWNKYTEDKIKSGELSLADIEAIATGGPEPTDATPRHWRETDGYPVSDWKDEVTAGDTRLGYHDWVREKQGIGN